MKSTILFLSLALLSSRADADQVQLEVDASDASNALAYRPTTYVDQFIGTINGGHVFAGASLPFGAVKAVADSDSGDNQGGYVSDGSPIRGISPLHDDGTGGGASLGQFKILPEFCDSLTSCKTTESDRTAPRLEGSQSASPGYFSISLASGIKTEVTVTDHVALHRFTFPKPPQANQTSALVFDLTNDLSHSFGGDGTLDITINHTPGTVRVEGGGRYSPSFGTGTYKVYFCLDIPNVLNTASYSGNTITPLTGSKNLTFDASVRDAGILTSFSTQTLESSVLARIGVSWTSPAKACSYAESEIPKINSATFDKTRQVAQDKWDKSLGTVQADLTGVNRNTSVNFWSSLYRTYLSPMNLTGDNPLWASSEPYYDSYYCIWDSFRVVHPVFAITQRGAQAEMVRALIDIYRHEGFLPDCRMSLSKGYTQGGSNADSLLSDSYVKGITAGINWEDGLAAMIKDATVTPPDWAYEGRGGIVNRAKLGYVPVDDDTPNGIMARSASRTLEYAFNDFSIALVARGLGKTDVAQKYLGVSNDWVNLWNPNATNTGFSGFIQPRWLNGSWMEPFDPRRCSPILCHDCCYLYSTGGEFYEAASWEYSFFVPHDMARAVNLIGGRQTFVDRMDTFFSNGFYDPGDEPSFLNAFQYNYVGRPDKSVNQVLSTLNSFFNTTVGGLPGNDDSGAMGGFVVFSTMGFYPVAGTSIYLISTPLLPTIVYPTSNLLHKATITTQNFDGAKVNKYIVSATLNGRPFTRNWFYHNELFGGAGDTTLKLVLGSKPSDWGTKEGDLPPSVSTTGFASF